jgi:hypothetical protein
VGRRPATPATSTAPAQPLQGRQHVRVALERLEQLGVAPAEIGIRRERERSSDALLLALGRREKLRSFDDQLRVEDLVADPHREASGLVELVLCILEQRGIAVVEPHDQQARAREHQLLFGERSGLVVIAELDGHARGCTGPLFTVGQLAIGTDVAELRTLAKRVAIDGLELFCNADPVARAGADERECGEQQRRDDGLQPGAVHPRDGRLFCARVRGCSKGPARGCRPARPCGSAGPCGRDWHRGRSARSPRR